MTYNLAEIQKLTDRIDTKYGDDDVVAELIGHIDKLVEAVKEGAIQPKAPNAIRDSAKGGTSASGYRNVYWEPRQHKWVGRVTKTIKGKRKFFYTGSYANPVHASQAVEELRARLKRGEL